MASAYSDDLRRKFFEAYQRDDGSLAVLAERFSVSLRWAEKLMRILRQTGRGAASVVRRASSRQNCAREWSSVDSSAAGSDLGGIATAAVAGS
jgi:transposase